MEGGCIESGLPLSDRGGRRRRKEAFLQLLLEVEAWDCLIRQLGEIDGRLRVCVRERVTSYVQEGGREGGRERE